MRRTSKEEEREYQKRYQEENREQIKKVKKAYYEAHKEETLPASKLYWETTKREKELLKLYGVTIDEWNKMFEKQEGRCKICHKHQSELDRRLRVDHEHVEGYDEMPSEEKKKYVRGLLCRNCNLLLGNARDSIDLLRDAISYLEELR